MPNQLRDAVSPYLRSHADNPVEWRAWGPGPFAEALERDVPVMVSIGYSTCHWCHVMARESFSDPEVAAQLSAGFVSVKVDREEHPDVDSSYLAAASAFTEGLGWPLTVFVTPEGRPFYAGTYFPPVPVQGRPSFRQVLDAVTDAWTTRRTEVDATASAVQEALAAGPASVTRTAPPAADAGVALPGRPELAHAVARLAAHEDREHGGFGGAPKFPTAPAQLALLALGAGGDDGALELVSRTLTRMAASPLRDPVEGGFFRYAVRRDWSEPHYERMLYDNAQLLLAYSRLAVLDPDAGAAAVPDAGAAVGPTPTSTTQAISSHPARVAAGVADFLSSRLRTADGAFGSAQDSESTIDGVRDEGGYYRRDAAGRAVLDPPPVDDKVLTGWNGLAISALAEAGARHDRLDWVEIARGAADLLLDRHVTDDGRLLRASVGSTVSTAVATLEDHGLFASGLLALSLATGEARYAIAARSFVDACVPDGADPRIVVAPSGGDPVLVSQGVALSSDPSEGAYPSGRSAVAAAALTLHQLTGEARYRSLAERLVSEVAGAALDNPLAYGAGFGLMVDLEAPSTQLVVVEPTEADPADPAGRDDRLVRRAREVVRPGTVVAVLDEEALVAFVDAGFELFAGRSSLGRVPTAYLCRDFVCRLPVTAVDELDGLLLEA
ncbi:thioredoxin domain-containing protein [Frigoribacterium sp. VKM Ac-2836]|uniref:thioredoxin domain-containing protein n=1 Tax=Frigoribacterium sp. VKM Ac-2836 TaxID=2739014 RepID=UPI001565D5ED|nr:thioredoxin domain-containing protein [Frigoribacterium sp. VKM Ac-2836]NRD27017.1 thioredoxin domain-containing protein [Frigoribacterium sp. VKM Ac-2836]